MTYAFHHNDRVLLTQSRSDDYSNGAISTACGLALENTLRMHAAAYSERMSSKAEHCGEATELTQLEVQDIHTASSG